jgi:drug/metabolite transporter (DMT)-like permease
LFVFFWLRGSPLPTRRQWINSFLTGVVMIAMSSGALAFSLKYVASGLVALAAATTPIWAVIFTSFWERTPARREVIGLGVGFIGIVILNSGSDMWLEPAGGIALLFFPLAWTFGSMWSRRLDLPNGVMTSATQLFFGGVTLLSVSLLSGEHLQESPTSESILGWIYLLLFGSMITFSFYNYVLHHATPVVATSYAYVNPLVAIFVGWLLADERLTWGVFLAGGLILIAVVIITTSRIPARRITAFIKGERFNAAP